MSRVQKRVPEGATEPTPHQKRVTLESERASEPVTQKRGQSKLTPAPAQKRVTLEHERPTETLAQKRPQSKLTRTRIAARLARKAVKS
jgi:hypothetical protein